MGIQIAKFEDAVFTPYSTGGDQTNPITTVHDGRINDVVDKLLYVRNDDAAKAYTSILLSFDDNTYPDDTEGVESGWFVKISPGATQPSEAEWAAIGAGQETAIPDISGIGSEAFWYRISSPRGLNAGLKLDISLKVDYIESTI